jgi:hypothetical protein
MTRLRWLWAVLLVGVVYALTGIVFARLAGRASSDQLRVMWRLGAWMISLSAFGAHIGYGVLRLHLSPRVTALHAALAVALGAFGLALSALLQASGGPTPRHFSPLAFLVWPVITGLPAFLVALGAAAAARRFGRE